MRKAIFAVWILAGLAIVWTIYSTPSDTQICTGAPNATDTGADQSTLMRVIDACTALISSMDRTDQDLPIAYKLRGNAHANVNQHDLAILDYTEALGFDPDYSHALIDRGHAYVVTGQQEQALQDYDRAIGGRPDHMLWLAYVGRARINRSRGKIDVALTDYDELLRQYPGYGRGFRQRGILHFEDLNFSQALADFDKALELDGYRARSYRKIIEDCRLGRKEPFLAKWLDLRDRVSGNRTATHGTLRRRGYIAADTDLFDERAYIKGLTVWAQENCAAE